MEGLNDTDKKILNLLQLNSKITHKEIGDELCLTQTPVYDRIKKLERKGIIKSYVTLLDPKRVNKGLIVLCFISLKEHGIELVQQFKNRIAKNQRVMECFHIAGNFDFFLKVVVGDVEEYQRFVLNDLSEIKNISQVQSSFVLGELKYQLNYTLD